jgi:hypothetical protein
MLDFAASFLLNIAVMGLLWCAARASVGRPSANHKKRPSANHKKKPLVNDKGRPSASDNALVGRPSANDEARFSANDKGRVLADEEARFSANDKGRVLANEEGLRRFWQALTIAWALNIGGNIAWGIHDILTSERLGIFTWVDGFYLARYAMIGWALGRYPREPRRWTGYATVTLAATALIWATLFRVMLPSISQQPVLYFMGGALYPILDVVLIYAALIAWLRVEAGAWIKLAIGLFTLAMLVYGAANWINFTVRAVALDASSSLAAFFWLLADVLTGGAAFLVTERGNLGDRISAQRPRTSPMRWLTYVPPFTSVLVLGILGVDWVLSGSLDWMLILCTVATLGITAYDAAASPSPRFGGGIRGRG